MDKRKEKKRMNKSLYLLGLLSLIGLSEASIYAEESKEETSVNVHIATPENGGDTPAPPSAAANFVSSDPENPGNRSNQLQAAFGLAYQPDIFNFGQVVLKEKGEQEIAAKLPQSGDRKFHVGVKAKNRDTAGWTLKVGLKGSLTEQAGVTLEIGNGTGEVKVNQGDAETAQLFAAPIETVSAPKNISVGKTEALVMQGKAGAIHNDVYDYELGEVTLKIADVSQIQAGDYSQSSLQWNLEKAP
ncbi:hypothetical protein DVW83_07805 [Enterococcus sp. VV15]|nr:hypothetical protein DVW83_07805 [Enterococcus sp. VV15]